MYKILVVVDMQNDFISGALGSEKAREIVPRVAEKIRNFEGYVFYTRDTHEEDYARTREGRLLPVRHCIRGTKGWELCPEIDALKLEEPIDKPSFGSVELARRLMEMDAEEGVESVTLIGLCTDICVISNAFVIKTFLPEADIIVDASCCAGVTKESHDRALGAMAACQIQIDNAE